MRVRAWSRDANACAHNNARYFSRVIPKVVGYKLKLMGLDNFLIKCLTTKFYAKEADGWINRELVIGCL